MTLKGKDAFDLFKQGRNAWNYWVEQNPEENIDFSDFDFSKYSDTSLLDFSGFRFPNGSIDFSSATFGDGIVSFMDARFGDGIVSFMDARFGESSVRFDGATFGNGDIIFYKAQFGNGIVSFNHATFGNGDVSFFNAKFGDGFFSFYDAEFGSGSVSFGSIKKSGGIFEFTPKDVSKCTHLNFAHSVFDCVVDVSEIESPVVLDFTGSRITHPVDLDGARIGFKKEPYKPFKWLGTFHKAARSKDATAFRRLKKLAKEADDHERVLDFFAKEMRASYWHSLRGWKLFAYMAYDIVSDYGRSVKRPLIGLISTLALFSCIYRLSSTNADATLLDGFNLALGNAIPFFAFARSTRNDAITGLFGSLDCIPDGMHVLIATEGAISAAFLFLILLALRNIYRS